MEKKRYFWAEEICFFSCLKTAETNVFHRIGRGLFLLGKLYF
ncbi:unknown [Blautia hydrogenotrophica CAG:147]|nr:hypothetical protein BLHYD_19530 [Blautia hydrogenotrophica DSM 10507]CCX58482.1 unknown [Blautia hydrogenotrophica CAG:147]